MDKKLPPELDLARLRTAPLMAVGIGFDCDVQIPLTRSSDKRGMIMSTTEGPKGPVLLLTLADGNGRALTAIIDAETFPGYLELNTRQCGRMRDMIVGTPARPKPPEPRNG